jgi:glucans biosynthesis protein
MGREARGLRQGRFAISRKAPAEPLMHRRRFLRDGATVLSVAAFIDSFLFQNGASASAPPSIGPEQPFDYARLKGIARARAATPWRPPPDKLPPRVAKLSWDEWQSIRFRPERALWAGEGLPFAARFFHLGFRMTRSVQLYSVHDGKSREIAYDGAMFDYGKANVAPKEVPRDLGFAGFNVFFHTDWERDCIAFQGASYFRAVDASKQYGMSQRGLAIDCGMSYPEEFPDFVAFFLERPAAGSDTVTVHALLDSPSVSGAYRFVIKVADTTLMDVDAALYPRKEIARIGIAPGTSMFFYGKNDRRAADDWRPEIHDSDGLQMLSGAGEWLWRPLINPRVVRVNSFADEQPRGFGLMQRERQFTQYQDDGVFYEKRPSVWVQPKSDWGKGTVMLVEIPTRDEITDNIVAFWSPADKPQPGREYLFSYRLHWGPGNPFFDSGHAFATRTGIGGVVGRKREYFSWRFVVDFAGGSLASLDDKMRPAAVITASRGRVETVSVRPLLPENGWRAMFDLVPEDDSTEPVNLRLYLALDDAALTETWLYQYEPPAMAEREAMLRS